MKWSLKGKDILTPWISSLSSLYCNCALRHRHVWWIVVKEEESLFWTWKTRMNFISRSCYSPFYIMLFLTTIVFHSLISSSYCSPSTSPSDGNLIISHLHFPFLPLQRQIHSRQVTVSFVITFCPNTDLLVWSLIHFHSCRERRERKQWFYWLPLHSLSVVVIVVLSCSWQWPGILLFE